MFFFLLFRFSCWIFFAGLSTDSWNSNELIFFLEWIDSYMSAWIVSGGWGKMLSWAVRQLSRLIWKTWPTLYSQLTLLKISLLNSQATRTTPQWWLCCCCCYMVFRALHTPVWLFLLLHWLYSLYERYTPQPERRLYALLLLSQATDEKEEEKRVLFSSYLFSDFFSRIFVRLLSFVHFVDIEWYCVISVSHVWYWCTTNFKTTNQSDVDLEFDSIYSAQFLLVKFRLENCV